MEPAKTSQLLEIPKSVEPAKEQYDASNQVSTSALRSKETIPTSSHVGDGTPALDTIETRNQYGFTSKRALDVAFPVDEEDFKTLPTVFPLRSASVKVTVMEVEDSIPNSSTAYPVDDANLKGSEALVENAAKVVEVVGAAVIPLKLFDDAYHTYRRDQSLAEYSALSLALACVLAFGPEFGVHSSQTAIKAFSIHMAVALLCELCLVSVEKRFGFDPYDWNHFSTRELVTYPGHALSIAFWIISAALKLFVQGEPVVLKGPGWVDMG
ncbi:hypothetical protein HDU96_010693 [Phlyctochytrium bullatum]|nr:hypothetical protein HDU96_010693 [Phlyctochytrium bullatum]